MTNRLDRQLDLLQDCNEHRTPPKEFMSIFCQRCRNGNCVNAGWAESTWEDRIATQVSRLLTNPNFGDPRDPQFKDVVNLDFRHLAEPLKVDSWEVPQAHLVLPERQTSRSEDVERAIQALSEARGGKPAAPAVEVTTAAEAVPVQQAPQPPVPVRPDPRPNPRHYTADTPPVSSPQRDANTAFPAEGLMLDGSPPDLPGPGGSTGDPWAPPAPTNQPRKVPVGARIRMGEEPKK
jgi:hypothetical protein